MSHFEWQGREEVCWQLLLHHQVLCQLARMAGMGNATTLSVRLTDETFALKAGSARAGRGAKGGEIFPERENDGGRLTCASATRQWQTQQHSFIRTRL